MLISISGNSIEEFKAELRKAWKTFELDADDKQLTLPIDAAPPATAKATSSAKEVKKEESNEEPKRGRGRPRKYVDDADADADADAGKDETTPPLAPVTAAEASEALREYMGRKGATKAKEALIKFGAGKFSEVKAADYPAFAEYCKSA